MHMDTPPPHTHTPTPTQPYLVCPWAAATAADGCSK